jgi:hypothetical protein
MLEKKRHTITIHRIVCLFSLRILVVGGGKGPTPDFELLQQARRRIATAIAQYGDAGYQGLAQRFANGFTPIKTPKGRELTLDEKAYNRALAQLRIASEHVNRRCQIFRRVTETSRGTHRHDQKTWTVVAALVNIRYAE